MAEIKNISENTEELKDIEQGQEPEDKKTELEAEKAKDFLSRKQEEILGRESELNPHIQRIEGFIDVVSDSASIKAISPRRFYEQFKIWDDGTTRKLFVYVVGTGWKSITLT